MNDSLSTVNIASQQASTVKLLTPEAERLLARLAPKPINEGSRLIIMGPVPHNISNEPKPPKLEPYRRDLSLGQVIHFKPEKGFGHLDTENGSLFFHVSGYRVPSIHEYKDDGKVRHIVQLERLPRSSTETSDSPMLARPCPVTGDGVLFLSGVRKSNDGTKELAQLWTLAEPFNQFMEQQQAVHDGALDRWIRLAKYRLTLKVQAVAYASIEAANYLSTLFEGTETSMLKDWFQYFKRDLNLNAQRQIVLSCSEYDESIGRHGPFVECDQEITEDFLGD